MRPECRSGHEHRGIAQRRAKIQGCHWVPIGPEQSAGGLDARWIGVAIQRPVCQNRINSDMYLEKFNLAGRLAIITGGAQGIGLACAEALAEAGAKVVV